MSHVGGRDSKLETSPNDSQGTYYQEAGSKVEKPRLESGSMTGKVRCPRWQPSQCNKCLPHTSTNKFNSDKLGTI